MADQQELINKYRPRDFDEVIGHEDAIAALQRALAENSHAHSYVLTGGSGLGKTTIARLIARYYEAETIETDAATYSGVDEMRTLLEGARHRGMSGTGRRCYVLNEVQRLSRSAFDALLTMLEEPPQHLFFCLTTTNRIDQLPEAVKTRCYHVGLQAVPVAQLEVLLDVVCEAEGWQVIGDAINAVLTNAKGSPRYALTLLQAVHHCTTKAEVERIITLQEISEPLVQLCRLLLADKAKAQWASALKMLKAVDDKDWGNANIAASRYIMGAMERARTDEEARRAWQLLEALIFPAATYDVKAAFYAAIGRLLWG